MPRWRRFLAQFQDALVILLLIATAISAGLWLYEPESVLPYEAITIAAIVLLNAVMGYVQQSRAEAALAADDRGVHSADDALLASGLNARRVPVRARSQTA